MHVIPLEVPMICDLWSVLGQYVAQRIHEVVDTAN